MQARPAVLSAIFTSLIGVACFPAWCLWSQVQPDPANVRVSILAGARTRTKRNHEKNTLWSNSIGLVSLCVRHSNSKPDEVPLACRQKHVNRPRTFWRHTFGRSKKLSDMVMMPTDPAAEPKGRANRAGPLRQKIKNADSAEELLNHVKKGIEQKIVDASVVAAAWQKCGYCRWWDTLLEVRRLHTAANIKLNLVARNICLTALTRSVNGEFGYGVVPERREKLLRFAKEVWNEVNEPVTDADTFKSGLGAALTLCGVANEPGALKWAQQLWAHASSLGFNIDAKHYADFIRVLEASKLYDRVDAMISNSTNVLNVVLLGALMNIAAEAHEWHRADALWSSLVQTHCVKPNVIAYNAWSKVHLLCGRPAAAAHILDTMIGEGIEPHDKAAVQHAQMLLVVCHSSPSSENFARLRRTMERGAPIVKQDASNAVRRQWHAIAKRASRLQSAPSSMRLRDVLVEWKAKSQSVMRHWPNFPAGGNYLSEDVV